MSTQPFSSPASSSRASSRSKIAMTRASFMSEPIERRRSSRIRTKYRSLARFDGRTSDVLPRATVEVVVFQHLLDVDLPFRTTDDQNQSVPLTTGVEDEKFRGHYNVNLAAANCRKDVGPQSAVRSFFQPRP